ncbi:MAG: hypothetical protein JWP59_3099, partial [Massilia sp.]|nr:hypothetical protein [Massilia sp.]
MTAQDDVSAASARDITLITGASGFVGKALCAHLQASGIPVVAAVRRRVPGACDEALQTVEVGDIDVTTDWASAVAGVSVVIHLAARAHILQDNAADPLVLFRQVNVDGTMQLARAALAAGARRFVFVSSVGVNGGKNKVPFTVTDLPDPAEPYALSKLEAEQGLRALLTGTSTELVIVRPPLVYGPDCPGNFRRLLKLIATGLPLPLASIRHKRSFVSIWNLVDFLCLCAFHPRAAGEVFLVSDMEDVALPDLLRGLASGMRKKLTLLPCSPSLLRFFAGIAGKAPMFDKLCSGLTVDAAHAREVLGWRPPV